MYWIDLMKMMMITITNGNVTIMIIDIINFMQEHSIGFILV